MREDGATALPAGCRTGQAERRRKQEPRKVAVPVFYRGVGWTQLVRKRVSQQGNERAKYKPSALRVRDDCYTKNYLNQVVQIILRKGKVIFSDKKAENFRNNRTAALQ